MLCPGDRVLCWNPSYFVFPGDFLLTYLEEAAAGTWALAAHAGVLDGAAGFWLLVSGLSMQAAEAFE